MRTGKLPEHTLKRSVLTPIRYRGDDTLLRPGIGHDGAVIGDMVTAMASTAFCYTGNEIYALHNALNNVIAAGGRPFGIEVTILMPEHSEEADLRRITDNLARHTEKDKIEILGGHTELVPSVNYPTVIITGYGRKIWEHQYGNIRPDMDIVMTKWVGLYGGSLLAELKKDALIERYPESYIEIAGSYKEYTTLFPELSAIEAAVMEHPNCIFAAHDVSNGGLFGGLWQLLCACNIGGQIELSEIYMKQEIVEVCEYFDINPYMMNGQGSLLLVTDEGDYLVNRFHKSGVEANVIGKTTGDQDRKVMTGEEERYLVPPKGDALNVVFYGQKMQI